MPQKPNRSLDDDLDPAAPVVEDDDLALDDLDEDPNTPDPDPIEDDDDDVDVDPVEDEPEEDPEPEPEDEDAFWTMVEAGIGEAPEEPYEALVSKLTADTLSKLPPAAKAIVKQLQTKARKDVAAAKTQLDTERAAVAADKSAVEAMRRDNIRRQAQITSFMNDPKVKAMLALGGESLDDVDPFSKEGATKIAQVEAARAASQVFTPMAEAAAREEQKLQWMDFRDEHPILLDKRKDAAGSTFYDLFKAEVEKNGKTWEEAHNSVLASRYAARQAAKASRERRARADSARRVRRDAAGGDPSAKATGVPPEVKKQGGAAVAKWHRDHPKAAQRTRKGV